jgi:class 3 adenylate cyclase
VRKLSRILGIVAIVLITVGIIFRILHYPGEIILLVGTLTFVLGFAIPYTIDRITAQSRRALQISTAILTIAISLIVVGGVLKILHLPFSGHALLAGGILLPVYLIFFARESEGRKLQLRKDRQLAAILFTDIVGFTAMMGEDEEKALRVLEQNRKIQKAIIRKHRGKWLKEMGDGSLVIFYTATEAIGAAIEIQHQIQESGNFNVRMGIHISEIVFTDTDVFGDGVNVASRISDKATANEICISEAVFQNIRNREDLHIDLVGEMELKNVSYKLTVYKIDSSIDSEGAKIRKLAR